MRERSADARSRRICGLRLLKLRGTFSRVSATTGVGKSASESRRACRSAVTTSGRGPSPDVPGSTTTAYPANLPDGTSITSPGRSFSSELTASSRRSARRARAAPFSRSLMSRRIRAYSMKSPRSHVAASA